MPQPMHPGDEEADDPRREGGSDIVDGIAERSCGQVVGDADLEDEDGDHDGEDAVGEGDHPRRIPVPLAARRFDFRALDPLSDVGTIRPLRRRLRPHGMLGGFAVLEAKWPIAAHLDRMSR